MHRNFPLKFPSVSTLQKQTKKKITCKNNRHNTQNNFAFNTKYIVHMKCNGTFLSYEVFLFSTAVLITFFKFKHL